MTIEQLILKLHEEYVAEVKRLRRESLLTTAAYVKLYKIDTKEIFFNELTRGAGE